MKRRYIAGVGGMVIRGNFCHYRLIRAVASDPVIAMEIALIKAVAAFAVDRNQSTFHLNNAFVRVRRQRK